MLHPQKRQMGSYFKKEELKQVSLFYSLGKGSREGTWLLCIKGINTWERRELFKFKDNLGRRINEHKLAMNEVKLTARMFLTIRAVRSNKS